MPRLGFQSVRIRWLNAGFHSKLYLSAYGSYLLPIGNTFGMPLYKIPKENIYNTPVVFVCEIFSEYTFYLQLQTTSLE